VILLILIKGIYIYIFNIKYTYFLPLYNKNLVKNIFLITKEVFVNNYYTSLFIFKNVMTTHFFIHYHINHGYFDVKSKLYLKKKS